MLASRVSTPSPDPRPRRRRWPWLVLAGFVLGAAFCFGLLLSPPVQGWLLRRFVASQPGWRIEFERIGAGPTGLDANGVRFDMPGMSASSEPIAIRVAPTRLLSRRELSVERVEARKIRLTLTPAQFASSPSPSTEPHVPPAPFDGVLRLLQAPLPWTLDAAQLDGEIVVRDGNESRLTGTFALRGGGLSSSTPGKFDYELAVDSVLLPPGPDHKLTSAGTVQITQTPSHGVARIAVEGDLHLPHYGALALPAGRLTFELKSTPTGEAYTSHVALGTAVTIDTAATLDAATSLVQGKVTLHADQTIAASLLGEKLPAARAQGELAFSLNLGTGDLDATVAGDFDARDWQKIMPQLALVDGLQGKLAAALTRRGDRLTVDQFSATLAGEKSAAVASITLSHPFDPRQLPTTPLAELKLAHWPLAWANPFLADAGLKLASGEFAAAWKVGVADGTIALDPIGPATIGSLVLQGEKLPPRLQPLSWQIQFLPRATASAARQGLSIDGFDAVSSGGDRIETQLAFSLDSATAALDARGWLKVALPSVLAASGQVAPFHAAARWDMALTGSRLHVAGLEFNLADDGALPGFALELLRPFDFDLSRLTVVSAAKAGAASSPGAELGDLLRLRFDHLSLAGFSELVGQPVAGSLVAGQSTVSATPEGGMAFQTSVPWRLEGVALGGTVPSAEFPLNVQFAPALETRGSQVAVVLEGLGVQTAAGNRVSGLVSALVTPSKQELTGKVALEAELPSLPHSAGTFGPLSASLHATFHSLSPRIMGADTFDLQLKNATGELLSAHAPQPFIFGVSDSHMVVLSTLQPLRVKLAAVPLVWLNPWLDGVQLAGTTAPAEFTLASSISKHALRAASPLRVEGFSARQEGRELAREAAVTFEPGLDLTVICVLQPTVQLAYTGTLNLIEAKVDLAGRRAVDFDLGLGFKGSDKLLIPDRIDLSTRLDFSAVPNGAALGLPARGMLVGRVNGELMAEAPVELWARLSGLPSPEGKEPLPPLEVTLRGKVTDTVFSGGVELLLAAAPRPTDLKFEAKLNLQEGGLNITSAVRSQFFDGAALLALARAFPPPPAKSPPPPARSALQQAGIARAHSAAYATLPFWGELGGSFDLDLSTVAFAPYRIDGVHGRLDADRSSLVVRDLRGEMFAGRWSGGLRIAHDPENRTGEHTLKADFRIEQFESARVIQTVFPNQLASVDARINVNAKVESHGNSFPALFDHSVATFAVDGDNGIMRLTVPKGDLLSTAAVFGGTVLLSPELRALGRLLKKFAEMPFDELRITGRRDESGEVRLDEFRFGSDQARLLARGRVVNEAGEPLMNRPLELSVQLAAKDELAVILGGMGLLDKKSQPNGFRNMRQPFALGGRAGAPDTTPLYDLLATAVSGSKGTWGFLMRKVEKEVEKTKPAAASKP